MIKLKYAFFIDLEGTLLNNSGEIDNLSVNLLKKLCENSIVTLVSSMSYNEIKNICNKYDLTINIFSTSDCIYSKDNNIYYDEVNYDFLEEIKEGIYTCYLENKDDVSIINYQERLALFYPNKTKVKTLKPTVITLSIFNQYFDKLKDIISKQKYKIDIIGKDNNKTLLKISKNGLTKANSINLINDKIVDKTVAISDSINDKDLLDLCDIKIAMRNADSQLKKYTDFVTELDNNHDGCMIELNKFIENK